MAYKNYQDNNSSLDEGNLSMFNEAALKMTRFHKIQDSLNILRLNALAYDPIYKSYNYESMFSLLESLRMEILGKISDTEKTKLDNLMIELEKLINTNPPFQQRKYYDDFRTIFVKSDWEKLKSKLREFEGMLRILMDKHHFGSPDEEEEGGFD